MKKIFPILLLALVFNFAGYSETNASANLNELNFINLTADTIYYGRVDSNIDFLSLREGPSVYHREILRIPPGAYVEVRYDPVRDGRTGFAFVKYNGVVGYASTNYIIRN